MANEPRTVTENGLIVVVSGGKYATRNPISRLLLRGFDEAVRDLIRRSQPTSVLEVGCGEGHVTKILLEETSVPIKSGDISETVLEQARKNVQSPRVTFERHSIYDLSPEKDGADLVVCNEVLEHLQDPAQGLKSLASVTRRHCIISVPWEPVWRMLNLARGAYIKDLGNFPGHLQHWTRGGFIRFVRQEFDVAVIRRPLPWTFVLATRRKNVY